jgi:6,7-dimethyl-8-ribityllumazine synthase
MATKDLSEYDINKVPTIPNAKVGIVVAEWNYDITSALLDGAVSTLKKHGVDVIEVEHVPGSFELIFGAKILAEKEYLDGIIVIGAVIRGETPHFDYISQGVTYGIARLNTKLKIPVIFGVLTTDNFEQAKDRAGGKLGNKGVEAAVTLLKMIALSRKI